MFATLKKYFMATRPSSLVISGIPVVMGTAMAYGDGVAHLPTAMAALAGALLIHAGTNITNDYGDFRRGADKAGDFDPMRGNLVGQISPGRLKALAVIAFLLVVPPTVYLIARAGWPVVVIAVCSVLAGIFYTAGRRPLGYLGLGDVLVLVFFGPVAVAGTYYVQSLEMNGAVIMAGLIPGLFAVAVLTINNIRDIEKDRQVGKLTMTVRFGKTFAFGELLFAIIAASLTPVMIYHMTRDHVHMMTAGVCALLAIPIFVDVLTSNDAGSFNHAIGETVKLLLICGFLFSVGWIL